jgi:hypothetical protein
MKLTHCLLTLGLAALCACSHSTEPPEIAPERGTELVFRLERHELRADGSQLLSAVGRLDGRPVGFDLELAAWRENPPGYLNMSTWESQARLLSQGPPSDELVRFLDTLYATRTSPSEMAQAIEVKAFSPWKYPGDLRRGAPKFLLLFPGGFEVDQPAEVWIEVDVGDERIHLREKDPRLRGALIAALSASA